MISREELIRRGARYKDGAKLEPGHVPEKAAPVVGEQTIDTKPIAEAINQLAEVVRESLESQRQILAELIKISRSSQP